MIANFVSDHLPEKFILFITWMWNVFLGWFFAAYDTLMDLRLLTAERASLVLICVAAMFFLPIIIVWLRHGGTSERLVVTGFLALPLAILILLQTPTGFVGTPDDNCPVYERGKMTFGLLAALVVPKSSSDIYGDAWLVILVKNKRWGDDVHECRLSLSDPKVRVLAKAIHDAQGAGDGGRFSSGQFTFSFGGRNEVPNVVIKGLKELTKPYPPEDPHGAPAAPPATPGAPHSTSPDDHAH